MKKIILDLDTGIDDALAILYALGSKECELIGITSSYGNVSVDTSIKNSLSILDLVGYSNVPVYRGSDCKLESDTYERREITKKIHGVDGVGDVNIPKSTRNAESKNAIDFLIDACEQYGNELTIVATSPLTNLAKAITKAPNSIKKVGKIVIMGGALTVTGNVTPYAEANIIEDPDAAKIVFESNLPIVMVGLDVTMRTLITLKETKILRKLNTKTSELISNMIDFYFCSYDGRLSGVYGCPLHDPLAVGIALHPELASTLAIDLTVETSDITKGRTIGLMSKLNHSSPSTEVCIQVDASKFIDLFMESLSNICK